MMQRINEHDKVSIFSFCCPAHLIYIVGKAHIEILHILAFSLPIVLDAHDSHVRDIGLGARRRKTLGERAGRGLRRVVTLVVGVTRRGPIDDHSTS